MKLKTNLGVIEQGERPTDRITNHKPQISLIHDLREQCVVGESLFERPMLTSSRQEPWTNPIITSPADTGLGIELNEAVVQRQLVDRS